MPSANENLPGPDFNRNVYEFDDTKQIWNQENYEVRVKAEADILVALEAMKTEAKFLEEDTVSISEFLSNQYLGMLPKDSYLDIAALYRKEQISFLSNLEKAQDECRHV